MDFCSNIAVIPQFEGTCWFNAILMSSFYSQEMRKLMIKQSKTWDKRNNFFKFLKTILKNSYDVREKKNLELFHKIKPEILLLKMLNMYDIKLKEAILKTHFGWDMFYISLFLKNLGINVLDITYTNFNLYNELKKDFFINTFDIKNIIKLNDNKAFDYKKHFNETRESIKNIPDVLLFKIDMNLFNDLYDFANSNESIIFNIFLRDVYFEDVDFNQFLNFSRIINFNGHQYILDNILLGDYNVFNSKHAIVGITCNNNRYVYNGWNSKTNDPSFKNKGNINPCSLMKFDWLLEKEKEFCLNAKDCKLDDKNEKDLCFSFNKGYRIFVYVRMNEDKTSSIRSSSFKNFSESTNIKLKEDLKKFYNIDDDNIYTLKSKFIRFNIKYESSLSFELNKKRLLYSIYDEYNIEHPSIKDEIENEVMNIFTEEEIFKKSRLMDTMYNKRIPLNINKKLLLYAIYDKLEIEHPSIYTDIEEEYYPINSVDYSNETTINLNDKNYIKKNLFYYYFIINLNSTLDSLRENRDIYIPIDSKPISINELKEIFDFEISLDRYIGFYKMKSLYVMDKILRDNYIILDTSLKLTDFYDIKLIIKLYGLNFFIVYLLNKPLLLDLNELIKYLREIQEEKEINIIINRFNKLNLISEITSIEEIIEYLKKEFEIRGGNKIKKLKRYI